MIVVNNYAVGAFNPLTSWTTDPVHGVWASDPLWVPPADGGAVSSWRNGGSVGGDLVQATGAAQPTYRASTAAFNNQPTVQGDGTDDFLEATVTAWSAPLWQVWIGSLSKVGGTGNEVPFTGPSIGPYINSVRPNDWLAFGSLVISGGTPDNNAHLAVVKSNGASSSLTIDGTSTATGNMGTLYSTTKLMLFIDVARTAGFYSGGHCAYAAVFTTDPTAQPEWATFVAWVEDYYGVTT